MDIRPPTGSADHCPGLLKKVGTAAADYSRYLMTSGPARSAAPNFGATPNAPAAPAGNLTKAAAAPAGTNSKKAAAPAGDTTKKEAGPAGTSDKKEAASKASAGRKLARHLGQMRSAA
jgi:hypothetical protein